VSFETKHRLKGALIKIEYREHQPKPDRGHPVRQRAKHAPDFAERILTGVIRAVRSGGQDVRDPFLKIEELVPSFLKSMLLMN
jgi:hypothetical protein